MIARRTALIAALELIAALSCDWGRGLRVQEPHYEGHIAELLDETCAECHSGDDAEAGWRVDSYPEVIGCVEPSGEPAVQPQDERAPILTTLDDEDHEGLLTTEQRLILENWIRLGAPARHGANHPPRFSDPRAPLFHGEVLRQERWVRMLDASAENACGRCHLGTPASWEEVTSYPEEAPACTSCHSDEGGVLACGTCHGRGDRASPPHDPCFHPDDEGGAHLAHVQSNDLGLEPLDCSVCHPERDVDELAHGPHGDGTVDVVLDPEVAGDEASYDAGAGRCSSVVCHDRGGDRAQPLWTADGPLGCDDCHPALPPDHNPAACNACHLEANTEGTALLSVDRHLNSEVDIGDAEGSCGACHGSGDDPWPLTGAHPGHARPSLTEPVDCGACHQVPEAVDDASHLDDSGGAEVALSGAAADREATPRWEAPTCSDVACHGARLPSVAELIVRWDDDSGAPSECGACHGSHDVRPTHAALIGVMRESTCRLCHSENQPQVFETIRRLGELRASAEAASRRGRQALEHLSRRPPLRSRAREITAEFAEAETALDVGIHSFNDSQVERAVRQMTQAATRAVALERETRPAGSSDWSALLVAVAVVALVAIGATLLFVRRRA